MRKFWLHCFLNTVFVFALLASLYGITQLNLFNAFDPLGSALGDMELTDIAFSQFREDPPIDTNIVIVNIGNLGRAEIAQQIMTLSQLQPKLIALDIIFSCDGGIKDPINCPQAYDTLSNMMFSMAIQGAGPVVLAEKLWQTKKLSELNTDEQDSIEHTDPELRGPAYEGFVNLDTDAEHQEDLKVCRNLVPQKIVNGNQELAFSVKIAMLFDSAKTKRFLDRGNDSEPINYRGNIVDWHGASSYAGRYMVLDVDQATDTTSFVTSMIKGKIVIMGFLGSDLRDTSWDDKFITPLNKNYAGKTRPDMYGVVVHANAVSMILNEDYIDELSTTSQYLIAFLMCFLNVALFWRITEKIPLWFDGLSVVIQLIQIICFTLVMIYMFNLAAFKLNLTVTLASIAVVGTCFEIYHSVILTTFRSIRSKWFTKRKERVLTTHEQEIS
jgi:CHASE2 domain-containing sensor protein